ncbi:MAG TPA: hypothetical protein VH092_13585 [Urbifossiella sp.]|jgi:hypothetical protein|nr:hypothetical protein [Urbifossiella sp.]
MTVDAILQQVANLSPAERTELLVRLQDLYGTPDHPAKPHPRADQTGVYSIDQIVDRVRRSS